MTALLTSSNACTQTKGKGVITSWTLTGSTYTGDLTTTDGYQLKADLTWKALTGMTADLATSPNSFVLNATSGIGTCVELLTSDSAALASTVTTVGNFAICHWMYTTYTNNSTDGTAKTASGAASTSDWGETRYLNASQWGTAGATIVGTSMQSTGTAITSAA